VRLSNDGDVMQVQVIDDGRGVDGNFRLDDATGLGLSIVRTLVTTELNGTIDMRPLTAADATAAGLDAGTTKRGTVVELHVPVHDEE
jgi:two-component sensor histidine kinase